MTDPALARHRDTAGRSARRSELTAVPDPVTSALPALRLLPAPDCEPPYDDDPAHPATSPAPAPQRGLRLVPAVADRPTPVRPGTAAAVRSDSALPGARPFAVALVHRLVEVRGGVRPVLQLQRDTTPSLYADLERALHRRARATGARPGSRDVRSVHVQERPEGVAEVCATVRCGTRMAALALRLEAIGGRWLCTQVQGL